MSLVTSSPAFHEFARRQPPAELRIGLRLSPLRPIVHSTNQTQAAGILATLWLGMGPALVKTDADCQLRKAHEHGQDHYCSRSSRRRKNHHPIKRLETGAERTK